MNDQMERFQRTLEELHKRIHSKYQIIESLDMRTRIKSYRIYIRGHVAKTPPVEVGFDTYEIAHARMLQLEAEVKP